MQEASIKSADRVLDVLEFLCRRGNSATHTELGFSLDIPKSSLSGLLRNLISRNYLEKNPADMTYSLGPAFFQLVSSGKQVKNILKIANAKIAWLTEKTHEASAFYLFKGDHVERVLGKEADYPLSYRMTPGVKFPLYSAAAGKAVLKSLSEKEQNEYLNKTKLLAITENTAKNEKELRRRLNDKSEDNITISYGENSVGVIALAIPILNEENKPLGAISIVIPEARFNSKIELLSRTCLIQAATKIQHELCL